MQHLHQGQSRRQKTNTPGGREGNVKQEKNDRFTEFVTGNTPLEATVSLLCFVVVQRGLGSVAVLQTKLPTDFSLTTRKKGINSPIVHLLLLVLNDGADVFINRKVVVGPLPNNRSMMHFSQLSTL